VALEEGGAEGGELPVVEDVDLGAGVQEGPGAVVPAVGAGVVEAGVAGGVTDVWAGAEAKQVAEGA